LWPRGLEFFRELAQRESLFEIVANTPFAEEMVGVCYITEDPSESQCRIEFGGVYVVPKYRGFGLAAALGKAAVSSLFILDPPSMDIPVIAHVHEKNQEPRGVLRQLGFIQTGQESPPEEVVPPGLERNEEGKVVGDLFEFQRTQLAEFADWLENFQGLAEGKNGKVPLEIDVPFFTKYKSAAIEALRDLSTRKPILQNPLDG
jgi:GNAT superfamily N-acetyltransferase